MESVQSEKNVYELFKISVIIKGLISFAEIVAGSISFFIPPSFITTTALFITQHAFPTNPNNPLAVYFLSEANHFSSGTAAFVGLYLLSRGLIKLVLIIALLRNQLWAYPVSLVVLALFVLYQVYQIITTHSPIVVAITLFDLVVMYFIWREYQIVKMHAAHTA